MGETEPGQVVDRVPVQGGEIIPGGGGARDGLRQPGQQHGAVAVPGPDAEQRAEGDGQAGLLEHLADCGLLHVLATIDEASRERPGAGAAGMGGALTEQDFGSAVVFAQDDDADRQLRVLLRDHPAGWAHGALSPLDVPALGEVSTSLAMHCRSRLR